MKIDTSLLAVALQETPAVIALLRSAFTKANPGVPPPTDQEVIAAEMQAFLSTVAKDDAWLAVHPPVAPVS